MFELAEALRRGAGPGAFGALLSVLVGETEEGVEKGSPPGLLDWLCTVPESRPPPPPRWRQWDWEMGGVKEGAFRPPAETPPPLGRGLVGWREGARR